MSHTIRIDRGLRPIGDGLTQVLYNATLRCLNHHWRRAADPGLSEAERRDAEASATGIIDTCRRYGLLTPGGRHV